MTIKGTHNGDLQVSQRLEILGTVIGSVVVVNSGNLELKGTILGRCEVQIGGKATIQGTIIGELENYGGAVDVWGVVDKLIDHGENTKSVTHKDSVIKEYARED
ncbi:hypothetical protein ACI2OW_00640 [Pseudomonas shirazica]|uniref:hypothetical protein n=1 Tax=Pseudomonas TaxID=286 RepID=UPI0038549CE6